MINAGVGFPSLRCREIFRESVEVCVSKIDSKSAAYEFRPKAAQSGGLETKGTGERIWELGRRCVVRGYWALSRARKPQRMLVAMRLAEED